MRKQIAAANWKMNLNFSQAQALVTELKSEQFNIADHRSVVLAVPAPYFQFTTETLKEV
ncbi:MAG: triose-phosphate isomerase, partial [bacterium]